MEEEEDQAMMREEMIQEILGRFAPVALEDEFLQKYADLFDENQLSMVRIACRVYGVEEFENCLKSFHDDRRVEMAKPIINNVRIHIKGLFEEVMLLLVIPPLLTQLAASIRAQRYLSDMLRRYMADEVATIHATTDALDSATIPPNTDGSMMAGLTAASTSNASAPTTRPVSGEQLSTALNFMEGILEKTLADIRAAKRRIILVQKMI